MPEAGGDESRRVGETPAAHPGSYSYRTALGLLLALIAYGSLYPLAWNFATPREFVVSGPVGLIDLVENVILFFPLGYLIVWHHHGRPRHWHGFALWFLITLLFASALQWLQKYLPRTPALSDIVFNMLGYAVGGWAALLSRHAIGRILQNHRNLHTADRVALLTIGLWLVAELFPLIPAFDVASLANNIKSLWQQDAWQPRRMLLHLGTTAIGLEACAQLIRSASSGRLARPLAALVVLAVLAGKFLIINQTPGLAVVSGIVGGALLWWGMDHLQEKRRLSLLMLIATLTYLLHAVWPWQLRAPPSAMSWLPFASSLSSSLESVITTVAFECLCFGAIIQSAVRMGARLGGLTLCTALLAFICEWTQRFLPTRTAEITSVFLALGTGWLIATLGKRASRPREIRDIKQSRHAPFAD